MKNEEWLLGAVGLRTLRNNNLLPTLEQSVKVRDVYETFIRFDDKPMITSGEAVQKSLIKYYVEGAFCIAFGDGKEFTKYYLKENVPFLEVNDTNYWLVEKSLKSVPPPILTNDPTPIPVTTTSDGKGDADSSPTPTDLVKQFKSSTVSGNLPIDQFTASFNYFIDLSQ